MAVTTKQLNPGPMSAARGAELISFGFRTTASSDPDFLWQCDSNAITSVVRASAGVYTVQFNKAYPRELVAAMPMVSKASNATDGGRLEIDLDGYSATTGLLTVWYNLDANGDGTWGSAEPADNTVFTISLFVQRVNALVTAHS